eukprot:1145754-Pelagomonas_calceolata.AAC.6
MVAFPQHHSHGHRPPFRPGEAGNGTKEMYLHAVGKNEDTGGVLSQLGRLLVLSAHLHDLHCMKITACALVSYAIEIDDVIQGKHETAPRLCMHVNVYKLGLDWVPEKNVVSAMCMVNQAQTQAV